MADKRKHIDQLYKDDLGSYNEAPREAVWDRIAQNLDRLDSAVDIPVQSAATSRRKRRGFWIIVSALLFISSGLFVAQQINKSSSHKQTAQSGVKHTETIHATSNAVNTQPIVANNNEQENKGVNKKDANEHTNTVHNTTAQPEITKEKENVPVKNVAMNEAPTRTTPTNDTVTALNNNDVKQVSSQPTATPTVLPTKKVPEIKQGIADEKEVTKKTQKTTTTVKTKTTEEANTVAVITPVKKPVMTTAKKQDKKPVVDNKKVTADTKTNNGRIYADNIVIEHIIASYQMPDFATDANKANTVTQIEVPLIAANAPDPITTSGKKGNWVNKMLIRKKHVNATTISAPTEQSAVLANTTATNKPLVTENKTDKTTKKHKKDKTVVNNTNAAIAAVPQVHNTAITTDNKAIEPATNTVADNQLVKRKSLLERMALPFDLGIKGSLETGTGSYTGNKGIFSGYAELSLSKKMSLLFQPGLVFTALNRTIDYGTNPYYANGINGYDSTRWTIPPDPKSVYKLYQKYDSMVVARKSTRPLNVGFEIPVMLKYKVSNAFFVSAGMNVNISKLFTISESTPTTYSKTTDTVYTSLLSQSEFQPVYRNFSPQHTSEAYTPLQQPDGNPIRLGYILGLGYQVNEKMNLELMMTQTLSDQSYIHDINIQSLYTQPYFRLSIGYKLYKHAKK